MNALQTTFRPELDPLWPRLTNDERALCSAWKEIFRRMDAASDKSAALVIIQREFGATVGSVSRSTVCRKQAAGAACGVGLRRGSRRSIARIQRRHFIFTTA